MMGNFKFVMASEAWPSLLTGSQTLGLGVLGLVCQRGVA
jgi:predicted AlkP superfamily phosphohydrolase/phosphomutase